MHFPSNLKKLLDTKQINYSLTMYTNDNFENNAFRDHHLRNSNAARSVLLEDGQGKVLALVPANCILDLNRLCQLLGRELKAVSPAEIETMASSKGLDVIPAIPNINGLETVIDDRLVNSENPVLLDSGKSPHLLEIDHNALESLMSDKAKQMDIAVPVDSIENENTDDLRDITEAVTSFTNHRIKQRLEDTLEMPPLPETAQRIIKLRVDPNADIADLSNIVEIDPSLAAQVVSWASSPYYSAPGKIRSIHDAIVRVLGFDMVLNLALGIALSRTLSIPKNGPYGSQPYWRSAVYMAATMEGLVTAIERQHRPGFGLAYLSGLLHNFGYLIIADVFPSYYDRLCDSWDANQHLEQTIIERQQIGVSRNQMCAWLMEVWNLPEEILVALRQQNNPDYDGEHAIYANLLYISQQLLRRKGLSCGPKEPIPKHLLERAYLNDDILEDTIDNIMESAMELENIANELAG